MVVTGVSGSGKSSLAFDTLYAEGQRRYVESLSAYSRQFMERMDRPDVDEIVGLSPAIAVGQRTASTNPRSTVATVTEIHDHLRLLFARVGQVYSPHTGRLLTRTTASDIVQRLAELRVGTRIALVARADRPDASTASILRRLLSTGYARFRVGGAEFGADAAADALAAEPDAPLRIIVDRITLRPSRRARLADSVELALKEGAGELEVWFADEGRTETFSERLVEPESGFSMPDLEPRLFSFNSPQGACPDCGGAGLTAVFDPRHVIPDPSLSLAEGAVAPWADQLKWYLPVFKAMAQRYRGSVDAPWEKLRPAFQKKILNGTGDTPIRIEVMGAGEAHRFDRPFEGVLPLLARRFNEAGSDAVRQRLARFTVARPCSACGGTRLNEAARSVRVSGLTIGEVGALSVAEAQTWVRTLDLPENQAKIAAPIREELIGRTGFLHDVGLGYLQLGRAMGTLSGGETQRVRLASQLGRALTGVLYVLDEPSIGLHPRDVRRLVDTLSGLRDQGNSVVVVEHDETMIRAADWVVDLGPGAGRDGGQLVAEGSPRRIQRVRASRTGSYLGGRYPRPASRGRPVDRPPIGLDGATGHNLQSVRLRLPTGCLVVVTGVSGSGKSSLIQRTLRPALVAQLHGRATDPLPHDRLVGVDAVDTVVAIDASPIGKTPRSNPATYTGLFGDIRQLFARLPESRVRGYRAGRFSFNVKGGRCEACQGDGVVRVEMHFLPDVYVGCEACQGRRYNRETLEIRYRDRTIADVLDLTVSEAAAEFAAVPVMARRLDSLSRVGLGYVPLGQSADTLSGGEAQRLRLAKELARARTGRTVYLLDEPTVGLHFDDVRRLLDVLQALVDRGNTVVLVEHDLDVVEAADWVVDRGPDGGAAGGRIVAEGPPDRIAKSGTHTGRALAQRRKDMAKVTSKEDSRR